jgi:hypothetical protein
VRLKETDAELRARDPYIANVVMSELMADGFGSFTKLYQVYYDGSSSYACGGASARSQFAVMYLRGDRCGYAVIPSPMGAADYWEYAMLHDSLHALGFVPSCAPHRSATPNWHVDDSGYDLMWGDSPWWGYPLVLDVGHDDYYLTGRSDCPDFAASPFLTSNPPPPPVLVLANPQIRRTGASVVATVAVTADGITPAAGKTSCSATLRGRSLPGRGSYAAGSARCAWTLPRRARGSLVGRIAVTVEGSHAAHTIAVPVR